MGWRVSKLGRRKGSQEGTQKLGYRKDYKNFVVTLTNFSGVIFNLTLSGKILTSKTDYFQPRRTILSNYIILDIKMTSKSHYKKNFPPKLHREIQFAFFIKIPEQVTQYYAVIVSYTFSHSLLPKLYVLLVTIICKGYKIFFCILRRNISLLNDTEDRWALC